ncbi:MAG: hypothetical protein JOZ32_14690 [Bryobacterales bacterium]|nr:hypothetical protein [Bryobacterales bacterium]
MPDLQIKIESAECVPFAAIPMLAFRLRVENSSPGEAIHSVALHAQIQIETARRRYSAAEQDSLLDLFGEPQRWGQTLRPMLWTHAGVTVPAFSDSTSVDLRVPCSFDFNLAATKYFYSLSEGEAPLNFLFSGSCFYAGMDGGLEVCPISWSKEARFRLPAEVWRKLMDTYYPNSAWLQIRQDVFDRLYRYKSRAGITTWEEALERLLEPAEEPAAVQ